MNHDLGDKKDFTRLLEAPDHESPRALYGIFSRSVLPSPLSSCYSKEVRYLSRVTVLEGKQRESGVRRYNVVVRWSEARRASLGALSRLQRPQKAARGRLNSRVLKSLESLENLGNPRSPTRFSIVRVDDATDNEVGLITGRINFDAVSHRSRRRFPRTKLEPPF
jgi:hypothetical protein